MLSAVLTVVNVTGHCFVTALHKVQVQQKLCAIQY